MRILKLDSWSLEKLLSTTYFDEDEKESIISIYRILDLNNEFEAQKIDEINKRVSLAQLDPILSGMNYSQTDILKHLKKLR